MRSASRPPIAAVLDVPLEEMDRPLGRSVDTDALDDLLHDRHDRSPSGGDLLTLCTHGLEVVVRDGRRVTIHDVED